MSSTSSFSKLFGKTSSTHSISTPWLLKNASNTSNINLQSRSLYSITTRFILCSTTNLKSCLRWGLLCYAKLVGSFTYCYQSFRHRFRTSPETSLPIRRTPPENLQETECLCFRHSNNLHKVMVNRVSLLFSTFFFMLWGAAHQPIGTCF